MYVCTCVLLRLDHALSPVTAAAYDLMTQPNCTEAVNYSNIDNRGAADTPSGILNSLFTEQFRLLGHHAV
jgi:hypothetical protein